MVKIFYADTRAMPATIKAMPSHLFSGGFSFRNTCERKAENSGLVDVRIDAVASSPSCKDRRNNITPNVSLVKPAPNAAAACLREFSVLLRASTRGSINVAARPDR
ncbi:MAG: hypothetical protein DRJ46_00475 [Thermoprotei archaeon]|nr:MAG: hypothetical protein DRJ46_00475 [Thermoprotei archaeon]